MNRTLPYLAAVLALGLLAGCGDGRKEPSAADVDAANAARVKAIDEDPTLTPEQKEAMKSRLGGVGPSNAPAAGDR